MMCSFVIVKKIKLMKRSLIYFCILFLGCQAVGMLLGGIP